MQLSSKIVWKCYLGRFRHQNAARSGQACSHREKLLLPNRSFGEKMSLQGRIMAPKIVWKWYLGRFQRQMAAKSAPGCFPSTSGVAFWRQFYPNWSLQGWFMALIWHLKWLQKRAFDVRLALGPSKNEFLGVVLENVRNWMKFLCENAWKRDVF